MKIPLLLPVCFLTVLFISCKKDNPGAKSKKETLTNREWVIQKYEEKEGSNPWINVFAYWSPCEKDNKWKFKPNFSMELNESAIACSGSTPDAVLDEVTWSFTENETKITIETNTYTIETLDETAFIIIFTKMISGITYQTKITFEH